jgi:MYXO-CTERM domain-containing protein
VGWRSFVAVEGHDNPEEEISMKTVLCVGALAAVVASSASAEMVNLGDNALAGGAFNSYTASLSGTLTSVSINFNYVSGGSGSWASDMILLVIDPSGAGQFWGGFNVNPGAGFTNGGLWGFDGPGSANDGNYSDTKSVSGLSGSGTWEFRVYNGWSTGPVNNYNNFMVDAVGLVPAPGAVALLGLAGLAGRRRRA